MVQAVQNTVFRTHTDKLREMISPLESKEQPTVGSLLKSGQLMEAVLGTLPGA